MKRPLVFCSLFFITLGVLAQSKHKQTSSVDNKQPIDKIVSDIIKSKTDSGTVEDKSSLHKRLILAKDTLILSDYMMSIDRVNDNLNSISDSSNLGFEVVGMGRRIDGITKDISIIRKNLRGRSSAFNIKNLTVRFWSTINNADHAKSEAFIQLSTAFADKKMQFE